MKSLWHCGHDPAQHLAVLEITGLSSFSLHLGSLDFNPTVVLGQHCSAVTSDAMI